MLCNAQVYLQVKEGTA